MFLKILHETTLKKSLLFTPFTVTGNLLLDIPGNSMHNKGNRNYDVWSI